MEGMIPKLSPNRCPSRLPGRRTIQPFALPARPKSKYHPSVGALIILEQISRRIAGDRLD